MTLLLALLLLAGSARAQLAETPGLSVSQLSAVGGRLPGLALSNALTGTGPFLKDALPVKPLKRLAGKLGPRTLVKTGGGLQLGVGTQGFPGRFAAQNRNGVGRVLDGGYFWTVGFANDMDNERGAGLKSNVTVAGAELGKVFPLPDGVVWAGLMAGYGWWDGTAGGVKSSGAGFGLSGAVDGRAGPVRFSATAAAAPGARRADAWADVAVSKRLSLGAGWRGVRLGAEDKPPVELSYPYGRLSYRLGR